MSSALIPESESGIALVSGFTCAYINCRFRMCIETIVIPHHYFKSLSIWRVEGRGTTHKSRQTGKTLSFERKTIMFVGFEVDILFSFLSDLWFNSIKGGKSTPASFFTGHPCTGTVPLLSLVLITHLKLNADPDLATEYRYCATLNCRVQILGCLLTRVGIKKPTQKYPKKPT